MSDASTATSCNVERLQSREPSLVDEGWQLHHMLHAEKENIVFLGQSLAEIQVKFFYLYFVLFGLSWLYSKSSPVFETFASSFTESSFSILLI